MRIKVKKREAAVPEEKVPILTDFIKLDSFLKFAAVVQTGGEAKLLISDGQVEVNGEICTQRGKKLRVGDKVMAGGRIYVPVSGDTRGEDDGK